MEWASAMRKETPLLLLVVVNTFFQKAERYRITYKVDR